MPIARILITKIDAKRNLGMEVKDGNVNVATNSRVNEVSKEGDTIKIDFGLETSYKPKIGSVDVEGIMYYTGKFDQILVDPKAKEPVLLPEVTREIHQAILRVPILTAISAAREVGLPVPINLPTVELRQDAEGSAG